jgi:2-polyprenyl-6-methoxyphenol hydroxylase-like FAD-dependent oxidoreductase
MPQHQPHSILIIGAGIAGLTAAIALSNKGYVCEVAEITHAGEPIGAALTITGRAIDTLSVIGLLEDCQILGHINCVTGDSYDAAGGLIGGNRSGGDAAPASIGTYRPVLSRLLIDRALACGVRIRWSTSIDAIRQTAGTVSVRFTDGTDGQFGLLVGADGIRSRVRELVFGDATRPLYTGQMSVRWMAQGPPIAGPAMMYFAPGVKLLGYALPKQQLVYVTTVSDHKVPLHPDHDAARLLLGRHLALFTAPYAREIARRLTPASHVIVRPFEWLLVPSPWFRGRVLLIGDAAHATTAHLASGGGMAMEDGVVLAECLAAAQSLEAGLEAFMQRRFERVRVVVDGSVEISELEQQGAAPGLLVARAGKAFRQLAQPY